MNLPGVGDHLVKGGSVPFAFVPFIFEYPLAFRLFLFDSAFEPGGDEPPVLGEHRRVVQVVEPVHKTRRQSNRPYEN